MQPPTLAPVPDPGVPREAVRLCESRELEERGRAFCWDVLAYRRPARAFALRIDGRVVAYLNRCAHVPAEMDWTPGEFLDEDRRYIVCSIHGAMYEPTSGRCVAGPGGRGRLVPLEVVEVGGELTWYPSRDFRPVADAAAALPAVAPPDPPSA